MKICVGNISMERFQSNHTDMLYDLINSPEVRNGMRNNAEIPYENHLTWVKENLLESDHTHLFITVNDDKAQGVVLIKNILGDTGELGIMVSDISNSRKILLTGKLVTGILYYIFHTLNIQNLIINIIPKNINSREVAIKIGAELQSQDETYMYFLLEKSKYESSRLNTLLRKRYQPICIE